MKIIRFCILIMLLTTIGCICYAGGRVEAVGNVLIKVNDTEDIIHSGPLDNGLNYPAEDQKVLANVISLAQNDWYDNSVYGVYPGLALTGTLTNDCGKSADLLKERVVSKNVLPAGWTITKIESVDLTNGQSTNGAKVYGTGHVCNVVVSPQGACYMVDTYLNGCEVMQMKVETDENGQYLLPAETVNMSSKGTLEVVGNAQFKWRKHSAELTQEEKAYLNPDLYGGKNINPSSVKFGKYGIKLLLNKEKNVNTGTFILKMVNGKIIFGASVDPNDMIGPSGVTENHYIKPDTTLNYKILFENKPSATFPAQDVVITNQLDPDTMNLDTIKLGTITFGNTVVNPPDGVNEFSTVVDLNPTKNLAVRIDVKLNKTFGTLVWTFSSIDPATGQTPEAADAGFLPPNKTPGAGEGSVSYTVDQISSLAQGTEISNQASIVFDTNTPLDTPVWTNIIDVTPPTSSVSALDSTQNTLEFPVSWNGSKASGSAIAGYEVYVKVDGGDFELFKTAVDVDKSMTFTGERGKTYSFYTRAYDVVGNTEDAPSVADATTTVSQNADTVNLEISSNTLVSKTKVSGNIWDYSYKIKVSNSGTADVTNLNAKVSTVTGGPTIQDDTVTVGTVENQSSTESSDTYTIRVDFSKDIDVVTATFDTTYNALGTSKTGSIEIPILLDESDSPEGPTKITTPTDVYFYETNAKTIDLGGTCNATAKKVAWVNSANNKKGSCKKTKAQWSAKKIPLKLGDNTITITATEKDKTTTTDSIVISYVDNTAPTVKISSPSSKATFSTTKESVNISGTTKDNETVSAVTWQNAATSASGTCKGIKSWKAANVALKLGANVITVTAEDTSGNTKSATITITQIDKTKPKVIITSPTSKSSITVKTGTIDISGTASDKNAITDVKWTNNRGGSGTCTETNNWSASGIVLQTKSNKITITATDISGNKSIDTLTVIYKP